MSVFGHVAVRHRRHRRACAAAGTTRTRAARLDDVRSERRRRRACPPKRGAESSRRGGRGGGPDAPACTHSASASISSGFSRPPFGIFSVALRLPDGLDQQALVGIAGHDRRPGLAALEQRLARVEPQAAHLLVGVAVVAVGRQDRPDVRFEELGGRRRRAGSRRRLAALQRRSDSASGSAASDQPRRRVRTLVRRIMSALLCTGRACCKVVIAAPAGLRAHGPDARAPPKPGRQDARRRRFRSSA